MNRKDLKAALQKLNVREDMYDLEGGHPSEALVLTEEGSLWRIFYSERGLETGVTVFDNEDQACRHFLSMVVRDPNLLLS